MDINLGGIKKKLEDNAMLVAILVSAYQRFNGDINAVIDWFTSANAMTEINKSLTTKDLLAGKLGFGALAPAYGGHLYSGIFKSGVGLYLLSELGIIEGKYKKLGTDLMWGGGIAAVALPGSPNGSGGGGGSNRSYGRKRFEGDYA